MTLTTRISVIVILLLCFSPSFAQQKQKETVESLSSKIKILEGQIENIDRASGICSDFLKKDFQNKLKELDLVAEKMKTDQKANNWILYGLGAVNVIAIIYFFIFLSNKAKTIGETQLEKKFDELFEKKKSSINGMIEKYDRENDLKREKSILVISKDKDRMEFMKRFFADTEFDGNNVKYENINEITLLNKTDLVLFYNKDKNLDHKEILDIVAETNKDVVCFYFGPDRLDSKRCRDKVNFANSKVQLYGNLINTLKYQSLL